MNKYSQRITQVGEDFRVADRLEIMDLVWRFTMSVDIGDRDMFEACFTDPLLWDLSDNPGRLTGGPADLGPTKMVRSEFVDKAFGIIGNNPTTAHFVQHCVNNPLITFTGASAATVLAHLRNPFHDKQFENGEQRVTDHMVAGLYHIDTAQQDGRWRISALRLSVYAYEPSKLQVQSGK